MTGTLHYMGITGGEVVNGYIENPTAVDPSGGPFISVGSKILGGEKVIFKIKQ